MLERGMADSERVDRRPEQLADCCYGLACIDALARRKRLLVTAIRVPGVVVSARVVASWGVAWGNQRHQTARPRASPRSSSSRRWHNSIVHQFIHLAEIAGRHYCDLFILRTPASHWCQLPYHGGYNARVPSALVLIAYNAIYAV
jgi:hypothetical protein